MLALPVLIYAHMAPGHDLMVTGAQVVAKLASDYMTDTMTASDVSQRPSTDVNFLQAVPICEHGWPALKHMNLTLCEDCWLCLGCACQGQMVVP